MSASYITDSEGNVVYPKTLAKCVNKGGSTLEEYLNDVEDATLIKPTVSRTDMVLTDSSNMNIQELHLFGKTEQKTTKGINLLKTEQQNETKDGITITRNDDGTYVLNGTATIDVDFSLTSKFPAEKGKTYRMTGISKESGVSMYVTDGSASYSCASGVGVTFTYTSESGEKYIHLLIPSGKTLNNITVKPMIVDGLTYPNTTYDDYEPYTGSIVSPNPDYPQGMNCVKNPTIKIGGSNILNFENKESFEKNGIVCVVTDGIVKTKGTATLKTMIYLKGSYYIENGTYIFNPNPTKGTETYESYIDLTNQVNLGMSSTSKKINKPITVDDNMSKYPFTLMISISKGATIDMEWKPQLLRNDTLLPYEPYKEIQSVQLTCELNGISDVRDELVVRADGTGQLIQRIQLYDCSQMPNNKSIVTNPDNTYYVFSVDKYNTNATRVISTHFTSKSFDKTWGNAFKVNGNIYFGRKGIPESITDADAMKQWLIENKVKILFQLIEPIIIDLSAEEVKKILALHTNKPNTTIWNDQNADMQITYVAAAKNYIDNKLTELENSISSTASITALEDCETE